MLAQAMKDAKPTNVRLGNPSCDHTSYGTIAHAHHLKMLGLDSWEGGTRVCDHLPTLHVLNTANWSLFSDGSFIVPSTRSPVEHVKITGRPGSKGEDCMVS